MSASQLTRAALAAGAIAIWGSPSLAQSATTYLDLSGGAGYSTNPFLRINNDEGSAFGRASANAVHAWRGERASTSLSAFVENSFYLNEYGFRPIFSLSADTEQQVSEQVRLFGSASVSGDIAGQLSNRFVDVPLRPEVPDPVEPPPITVVDPDFFAFSGRHYVFSGQGGAAITATERSSIGVSGGAQRTVFTGNGLDDYTTVFGSGSYNHTLSERTTVGASLNVRRTEYDDSDDRATIINPAATIRTRLSEQWDASASAGVLFANQDFDGDSGTSTSLSFSGSLCRTVEYERLCGRVAREAYSAARSSLLRTTSVEVDWFRRLDEGQTVQLSASIARFRGDDVTREELRTQHYRLAASYSRRITPRLSAGTDVGVRRLTLEGPDPDTDLSGSVFLRYRIGDL